MNYDLTLSDNNSHQSWDQECSENVIDLEDEEDQLESEEDFAEEDK